MNLIDADALKEYILRSVPNWSEVRETVLDCIANSPTIEERKKGKWLRKLSQTPWPICSECGIYGANESNYCPNCGAYMKGENDGK